MINQIFMNLTKHKQIFTKGQKTEINPLIVSHNFSVIPVFHCILPYSLFMSNIWLTLAPHCYDTNVTSIELKSYNEVFRYCSGLTFKLRLEFPDGYPYTAPTVRFTSPCYHPNVDQVRTSYFLPSGLCNVIAIRI